MCERTRAYSGLDLVQQMTAGAMLSVCTQGGCGMICSWALACSGTMQSQRVCACGSPLELCRG